MLMKSLGYDVSSSIKVTIPRRYTFLTKHVAMIVDSVTVLERVWVPHVTCALAALAVIAHPLAVVKSLWLVGWLFLALDRRRLIVLLCLEFLRLEVGAASWCRTCDGSAELIRQSQLASFGSLQSFGEFLLWCSDVSMDEKNDECFVVNN
jgi:hypothetical protein